MYHELRTYRVKSPNMMQFLHRRMERHMRHLFAEHGMRLIGAWEMAVGREMPTYMYMLEWDDLAQREQGWQSFYADPRVAEMNEAAYRDAGGDMFHDFDVALLKPAAYVDDLEGGRK
jgi:NIPSNAP protein